MLKAYHDLFLSVNKNRTQLLKCYTDCMAQCMHLTLITETNDKRITMAVGTFSSHLSTLNP